MEAGQGQGNGCSAQEPLSYELFHGIYVQKMVVIAPPKMSLGDWTDQDIVSESQKFGTVYESIASEMGLRFLNACGWDLPLCYDGVHLTEEAHLRFAEKTLLLKNAS